MGVKLAHNQYGKAETRVVRVYRDADPHELKNLAADPKYSNILAEMKALLARMP